MRPQHDKTDYWISKGIFADLQSFADLEIRINALEIMKDEGDVFEIFVEGLLATQSLIQCEEHWIVGKIPLDLRNQYNLPNGVLGIDGIYRSKDNNITAYQVKYRRNSHLTFSEVAPFLGVTEKFTDRVIFTNAQSLSENAKIRSRWFSKSDFYDLSQDQIAEITSWIYNKKITIEKYKPDPRHQIQALDDIAIAFESNARATAVLACGTGKTLIGLWACERQRPKSILVLVPSLTLLQQTLKQWSSQNNWGERFSYLCVCSDASVDKGDDALHLNVNDVGFRVDTDPKVVKEFLASDNERIKVVFSTYHSSQVVAEGAQDYIFDFAIFDEAHKTTGIGETYFTYALSDKNIQIKKRLFMTATPRHINIRKRDKDGDFKIQSMDNVEIYGPKAHLLSFRTATQKDIICDYKIIISVIDKSMIDDYSRKMGFSIVDYNEVSTRWLADIIALKQAIHKVDAKKIITFHSRVKAADEFASNGPNGLSKHLDGYSVFHVNGNQKTSDRQEIIRNFEHSSHTVLTNARCLTEGIDVPAIDMVAFIDPRSSRIDITQAIGRAMRKPRGNSDKKFGYILVPLFVDDVRENIDDVIKSEGFQQIADVINALRENDEELADILTQLREDKGCGKGIDKNKISDRLEFIGPQVDFEELASSLTAALVDRLTPSWDEWYGMLKEYYDKEGHCRVPQRFVQNGFRLGFWVGTQRQTKDKLSEARKQKLDEIGFVWDPFDDDWNTGFENLIEYKNQYGDCRVPSGYIQNKFNLGAWIGTQRNKKNQLSEARKQKLDEIGFVWNAYEDYWNIGFENLVVYKNQYGDCRVPIDFIQNKFKLGAWIGAQRNKKDQLSEARKQKLDEIGFVWDPFDDDWNIGFENLVEYKNQYGDCRVPQGYIQKKFNLGKWVSHQRQHKSYDNISDAKKQKLDELGFIWDPFDNDWNKGFDNLLIYKSLNGDCRVPQRFVQNGFRLGGWVRTQRETKDQLSEARKQKLEEIGFVWDVLVFDWNTGFENLVAYKNQYGDCRVPSGYIQNKFKLGIWVRTQRETKDQLSEARKQKLEEIGFVWDVLEDNWNIGFEILVAYKHRYGDCRVPVKYQHNNFKLGQWVSVQRNRKDQLSEDRKQKLEEIGFVWDASTRQKKN